MILQHEIQNSKIKIYIVSFQMALELGYLKGGYVNFWFCCSGFVLQDHCNLLYVLDRHWQIMLGVGSSIIIMIKPSNTHTHVRVQCVPLVLQPHLSKNPVSNPDSCCFIRYKDIIPKLSTCKLHTSSITLPVLLRMSRLQD